MKPLGQGHRRMFTGTKEERLAGYEELQQYDIFQERERGKRPSCYYYDGKEWVEVGPSVGQAIRAVRDKREAAEN